MTQLPGKGIVLRPFRPDDVEAIYQGANNPTLARFTGTQATFSREQVQAYITWYEKPVDRAGFIIAQPDTLEPLGEVVINEIDPINRSANIRITLFDEAHLGKGYGSEAMRLMVDYGFRELKLHRISLEVYEFNPRAIRSYEKVGFKREGVLRDVLYYDGAYHSAIVMSILAHEWAPSETS